MPPSGRHKLSWSDRAQAIASTLTGLAAVAALIFTAQSLRATDKQLSENAQQVNINEQGQFTDRFNAAITNLASSKTVIQLGGIYALQRIMTDSARDQPTVLNTLCAYIRFHDPLPGRVPPPVNTSELFSLNEVDPWHKFHRSWPASGQPSTDIQAALTVIGSRNPAHDGSAVIDLKDTNLTGADLRFARLGGAELNDADLAGADLTQASLPNADLAQSNLTGADVQGARMVGATMILAYLPCNNSECTYFDKANLDDVNMTGADAKGSFFIQASLTKANMIGSDLADTDFFDADAKYSNFAGSDLQFAQFPQADLQHAIFGGADLDRASLTRANMSNASLEYTQLSGADLSYSDLRNTSLTKDNLTKANLTRANLTDAKMTDAILTGAKGMTRAAAQG
jgi:uncharacterized protein YjbI with pentapeptide repeats